MQDQLWDVIAVVPASLEAEAAAELEALGAQSLQTLRRAVRCRMDRAGFYRAHLQARLPFQLLRLLAHFPCASRAQLYRGVQQAADWQGWLPPQLSFRVEASGKAGELNHSHYTALEVKNALWIGSASTLASAPMWTSRSPTAFFTCISAKAVRVRWRRCVWPAVPAACTAAATAQPWGWRR